MKKIIIAGTLAALSTVAFATPAAADEMLRYDWRLRGLLSWVAGVRFPTSGTGILQNSPRGTTVDSQLRVNAGGKDFIEYRSSMDASRRTLASMNGYSFGSKSEHKETVYDYTANVARLAERDKGQIETKTRPLNVEEARDVLTTITFLREHAATINGPLTTDVYAEGKAYRVTIKPDGLKSAEWQGKQVPARVFRVVAAPGAQKKFPGLTVWLSEDAQRLPLRIVIDQQYASLDLRLKGA
jgi:hypothetical protein